MGTLHEGLLYDGDNMEIRKRWIALLISVIKEKKVTNNPVGASLLRAAFRRWT
jgi:hypothetical protein